MKWTLEKTRETHNTQKENKQNQNLKVKQDGLHQKLGGEPSSRTLTGTTPIMNVRENLTIQRHTQHCE